MTAQTILNVLLSMGTISSPIIAIIFVRQRLRAGDTKIDLDKKDAAIKSREALSMDQDREQKRETHWQAKLDDQERKLDEEIAELRAEVNGLQRYINEHIPWDWDAVRQLRLAGIEIDNPPSLIYIRKP